MSKYVGIDTCNPLGQGAYKHACKAKEVTNEKDSLFTTDEHIENLAIVSIELKTHFKNSNQDKVNEEIEKVVNELRLQDTYSKSEPKLGPKIYSVTLKYSKYRDNKKRSMLMFERTYKNIPFDEFLDNPNKIIIKDIIEKDIIEKLRLDDVIIEIILLEDLCGREPGTNKPLVINENFFEKVNELIENLIRKSGLLFADFKPQNTCPQYDSAGNMTSIIGLDFDTKFMYELDQIKHDFPDLSEEKIFDFAKDYMFIQFCYLLMSYGKILKSHRQPHIPHKIQSIISLIINRQIPPEKIYYQFSIFLYVSFEYIISLSNNKTKNVYLKEIKHKFPLFSYCHIGNHDTIVYNINYSNEGNFTNYKMLLWRVFTDICNTIYTHGSGNYLIAFLDFDDIVNPPQAPLINNYMQEEEEDGEEDGEDGKKKKEKSPEYSPINYKPKAIVKINHYSKSVDLDDMFGDVVSSSKSSNSKGKSSNGNSKSSNSNGKSSNSNGKSSNSNGKSSNSNGKSKKRSKSFGGKSKTRLIKKQTCKKKKIYGSGAGASARSLIKHKFDTRITFDIFYTNEIKLPNGIKDNDIIIGFHHRSATTISIVNLINRPIYLDSEQIKESYLRNKTVPFDQYAVHPKTNSNKVIVLHTIYQTNARDSIDNYMNFTDIINDLDSKYCNAHINKKTKTEQNAFIETYFENLNTIPDEIKSHSAYYRDILKNTSFYITAYKMLSSFYKQEKRCRTTSTEENEYAGVDFSDITNA